MIALNCKCAGTVLILRSVLVAALLPSLTACGWLFGDDGAFRDRSNDYRRATVTAPLRLPEGVSNQSVGDSYAIPPTDDHAALSGEFVIPRPEPMGKNDEADTVRINRLGDQQWILVDSPPGQVWPRLRAFLGLNQLAVVRSEAAAGVIETGWLQPQDSALARERYRLRIEQGVQRGSTEIYLLQASTEPGAPWPEKSSDRAREDLMVQALAQYMADSGAAAAVSMLAQQALDSSGKVAILQSREMQPYMQLKLPYDRAWASLERALSKAPGYQVNDLDRSQGLFYVHFREQSQAANSDEEPGFFARWFGGDDGQSAAQDQHEAYLLRLQQQGEREMHIRVERQDGQSLEPALIEKMLKVIKGHLA